MWHHLSRKRDKPLRTYGRRSTATPEPRGEPPAKKIRVDTTLQQDNSVDLSNKATTEASQSQTSSRRQSSDQLLPQPSRDQVHRGSSILNYFKPIPAQSPILAPTENKMTTPEKPSPASSTQGSRIRRAPRLLRLRAASRGSDGSSDENASSTGTHDTDEYDSSPDRKRKFNEGLQEGGPNLLNLGSGRVSPEEGQPTVTTRSKKAQRSPAVQTTLNISAQAAFAECKECDTVWNPLYPDDVKYHAKRHAKMTKGNKRKVDEL